MEAHSLDDQQAWIEAVLRGFQGLDDPRGWITTILPTLGRSPLYQAFATGMAEDADLVALLNLVDKEQPLLILFFTVVNFLLLREQGHPLAQFYPSLSARPRPAQQAYPSFRQFCLAHREELRHLLPQARLQTNEVTRCACLLPAFHLVAKRGGGKPLALIEIGASAGLHLNWFRYGYTYQHVLVVGDRDAPVQLHCELRGERVPDFPEPLPAVACSIGIDLHPLSLDHEADRRWLRAHLWPEETWRFSLLEAAIHLAQDAPPLVVRGNASHLLPGLLADVPAEQTVCVLHSFALNQGPRAVRQQIEQQLAHASRRRVVYQVALEVEPGRAGCPTLDLHTYDAGVLAGLERLAICGLHGAWMRWQTSA